MIIKRFNSVSWWINIAFTLALVALMGTQAHASISIGTKIGVVLSTDIIATINHKPIPSMNINGYTVVVVEDLRAYGFDVVWNEMTKTLTVTRNEKKDVVGKEFNIVRMEPGTIMNPVLHTDIKTYLDGREIVSFNIGGLTAVYFNQLRPYGVLQWDEASRVASLDLFPPVVLPDTNKPENPAEVAVTRSTTQLNPRDSTLSQHPLDKSTLPDHISVGLFFNEGAVNNLRVSSPNGFTVGHFSGEQFDSIFRISDTHFISIESDNSVYIGLKEPFTSPGQAQEMIESLSKDGVKGVMARETAGWNVYIGPYSSARDADADMFIFGLTGRGWVIHGIQQDRVRLTNHQNVPVLIYHDLSPLYLIDYTGRIEESILQIGSNKYRGAVTALRNNESRLTVINRLLIEQYLYGVVPREMPASWHMEALKAQAVAARGFALANIGRFRSIGFDVCNSVNSQVYGGYNAETARTRRAVDETYGKVMTFNGKLIVPYFHSNSGGQTESSENVWTEALPYARGVYDPYSLDAPHSKWSESISFGQLEQRLLQNDINIGNISHLYVEEISENGRVMRLIIHGTRGSHALLKQESRWIFGLRSNYYRVSVNNNHVVFEGRGFGHGVGMSQHGARVMAELGYSWQDILAHYYSGIRIE